MTLEDLGWNAFRAAEFAPLAARGLEPARVAVHHKSRYMVYTAAGERSAFARAKFRVTPPVVGDWVAVAKSGSADAVIEHILTRTGAFSRKVAGRAATVQVVAANVDVVWVVTGIDRDLNLRRLERYLALTWECGARPVVVVTRVDLLPLSAELRAEVTAAAPGVPVHAVSNVSGEGIDALHVYLEIGRTIALLGSSGVGKSTLVNRILGEERQPVNEVRVDAKGRHTTTRRELVRVPGGGILLDTPGMRELALWEGEEGLGAVFGEIEALAPDCRFGDCRHREEPGCAVRDGVTGGWIDPGRLASYHKLQDEREALERRRTKYGRRRE